MPTCHKVPLTFSFWESCRPCWRREHCCCSCRVWSAGAGTGGGTAARWRCGDSRPAAGTDSAGPRARPWRSCRAGRGRTRAGRGAATSRVPVTITDMLQKMIAPCVLAAPSRHHQGLQRTAASRYKILLHCHRSPAGGSTAAKRQHLGSQTVNIILAQAEARLKYYLMLKLPPHLFSL